jgi:uncharacterized damage-inducible protein DinB
MVRVEHVLESWKAVRQDTAGAVEDFPEAELDFRPTADVLSFREAARHILDAGDGLTGLLLTGEDNFATPEFRNRMASHMQALPSDAGPIELTAALRTSVEQRTAAFAAQPEGYFDHMITRFDGAKVTRLEMLQMIKEHEMTHRAHMFLCLRMKGIVPAPTRRRMARAAAK